MQPLFFGRSDRQLFGAYHPPTSRGGGEGAVLICPPFGREYMSTHRALRHLAVQLAKGGLHVLRFDYSCTGDSAGASDEASVNQWLEDVSTALEELKDTSGSRKVSVIGLRLGATLAAMALHEQSDIADMILWDPVVSGHQYVRDLIARGTPRHPDSPARGSGIVGIEGFPLTPVLQRELETIDLRALPRLPADRHAMVVSEKLPEYEDVRRALVSRGIPVEFTFVDVPGRWNDLDRLGVVLMPHGVIQAIVNVFVQEASS
jgi:pimeloyl-ACP methyl ester carboxylesterase